MIRAPWPIALCVCLAFGSALASEIKIGSAEWLEEQLRISKSFQIPDGVHAQWHQEIIRVMSNAELAAIERRVEGNPDHPDRMQIMFERRRIEEGPDVSESELFYANSDTWRINRTTIRIGGYGDMGYSDGFAWQLSPEQVQLIDEATAPRGYEPSTRRNLFQGIMRMFLVGPFATRADSTVVDVEAELSQAGNWRGRFGYDDMSLEVVLEGQLVSDKILVTASELYRDGELVSRFLISEPEWNETVGAHVYPRWVGELPDGTVGRVYSLRFIKALDPAEMRQLIRPPKIGGTDAIRGEITATQLVDFRSGPPVVNEIDDESGRVITLPPVEQDGVLRSRQTRRVVGWVSGVVIIGVVFALWIRSRSP